MKMLELNKIYNMDVLDFLKQLDSESVQCIVTSPPYWGLRDYKVKGQIGQEPTMYLYITKLVQVFSECRRVLKADGTLWLNIGDSYSGSGQGRNSDGSCGSSNYNKNRRHTIDNYKPQIHSSLKSKNLLLIPARMALALQDDGWILRSDIIWHKPNAMPESCKDRPTSSYEHIFLFAKSKKYYYDAWAIKEPLKESSQSRLTQNIENQIGSDRASDGNKKNGNMKAVFPAVGGKKFQTGDILNRTKSGKEFNSEAYANKRNVWTISTEQFKEAHFAVFPREIPRLCIFAGSKEGDTVLDIFMGSGTTAEVAHKYGRNFIGCELNPEYIKIAEKRLMQRKIQFV